MITVLTALHDLIHLSPFSAQRKKRSEWIEELKKLGRQIGRQRRDKESQWDTRRTFQKKCRKEQRRERMKKRQRGEKRTSGSQSQCKYTSKHCCKRWYQIVNAAERWGSGRWLRNVTCIFKTHANAFMYLNNPQAQGGRILGWENIKLLGFK